MKQHLAVGALALISTVLPAQPGAEPTSSLVGRPAAIDQLVLPGTELTVKKTSRDTPVIVRIKAVYPHGTDFRYDLEFTGMESGSYDLRDYLIRKDDSSAEDLPNIPVRIDSSLPPDQIRPRELAARPLSGVGGYRNVWIIGAVLWLVGLAALLLAGRNRSVRRQTIEQAVPLSLADQLRPLVQQACQGNLSDAEKATLEKKLIACWTKRLELGSESPEKLLGKLRNHRESGPFFRQIEAWLHAPPERKPDHEQVTQALRPYENL